MIEFPSPPSLADIDEADYQVGVTRARIARLESLLAHETAGGNPTENLRAIIDGYRRDVLAMVDHRQRLARQLATRGTDTESPPTPPNDLVGRSADRA